MSCTLHQVNSCVHFKINLQYSTPSTLTGCFKPPVRYLVYRVNETKETLSSNCNPPPTFFRYQRNRSNYFRLCKLSKKVTLGGRGVEVYFDNSGMSQKIVWRIILKTYLYLHCFLLKRGYYCYLCSQGSPKCKSFWLLLFMLLHRLYRSE